jgi:hypothetical protein
MLRIISSCSYAWMANFKNSTPFTPHTHTHTCSRDRGSSPPTGEDSSFRHRCVRTGPVARPPFSQTGAGVVCSGKSGRVVKLNPSPPHSAECKRYTVTPPNVCTAWYFDSQACIVHSTARMRRWELINVYKRNFVWRWLVSWRCFFKKPIPVFTLRASFQFTSCSHTAECINSVQG